MERNIITEMQEKREERQYIITEIKKYNKKVRDNKRNIILATILGITSTLGINFSSNLLLVKVLGFLILSASLFTIGFSIYKRKELIEQRNELVNKKNYASLESSYSEDTEIEEQKTRIYYEKIKKQK